MAVVRILQLVRRPETIQSLALLLVIFILGFSFYTMELIKPASMDGKIVHISPGSSTTQIANLLAREDVIRSPIFFRLLVVLSGRADNLKAGYYYFPEGANLFDVIEQISQGRSLSYRVTIPEGLTLEEIASKIEEAGGVPAEDFLQAAEEMDVDLSYLPDEDFSGDYRLQGYLFPATYTFPMGSSAREIIMKMVARFNEELSKEMKEQAEEKGFTIHELITIASMVEREARLDEERPLISAVIHNRLELGMYLQIDATVQYALPEWRSRLLYEDLRVDSPYNTYLYQGLPPGPIASPGRSSIQAAFYPADVDYLFYVARPDGSHFFSRTYEDHLHFRRIR